MLNPEEPVVDAALDGVDFEGAAQGRDVGSGICFTASDLALMSQAQRMASLPSSSRLHSSGPKPGAVAGTD